MCRGVLGFPPVRVFEFYIELLPSTAPFHMSLYQVSLSEKEELRRQLDNFCLRVLL